ncbi:tripartite tricarboxylate transporter TctB family protein [Paenibacillus silviterrae]|uniref:tripartite tricarboxylate transporter TctB family protein n=1 Tax=Paenibacillus silviterrae TaxID=3242194 RepID=UPI0025437302|nr:tripartite tricarboxylate transporter TctB family protein [Paenibacillus chinjuensis]
MRHTIADRVGGSIAAVLGLLSVAEAVRLYPDGHRWFTGDHTFPALLGIGLFVLGVMIASGFRAESFPVAFPEGKVQFRMGICVVILLGYALLLPFVGYLLGTWLTSVGLFGLFGSRSSWWWKPVLYSSVITVLLDVLFIEWLHMSFPQGIFGW